MALNTVLGFEASDAIANLKALTAALAQYNAAIAKSASATKAFNQAGKFAAQSKSMDAAKQSMLNYGKTVSRLSATHPVMLEQKRRVKELSDVTQKSTHQMILSWKSVIRIFTIQVIHQIISKLSSSLTEATNTARNFAIAISEIETIAGNTGATFESLRAQAIEVAEAIGQPLSVVAEAQYQLFSEDIGNARQNLEVMTAAQKLSIASVSSLDDAILLLTGTIHAYRFSTSEAETIAAKYFKTIELGRVRAEELANTMGRVTVMGAQLGIEFDELLATIATLTISGLDAAEALTLLTNVQLKLIRPTEEMKKAFAELGVGSAEAGIQIYGFQGFIEKLRETTQGTASEMGELFGRVRATRGALGITGAAAADYERRLSAIKETSSELLDQKLELIWESNAKQVEIELNKLSVGMTKNFGQGVNIVLQKIFNTFGGAVGTIKTLTATLLLAGSAFLIVKTGAIKTFAAIITGSTTATISIKAMGAALLASPVFWAAAVAAASIAVVAAYNRATAAAKQHATDVINSSRSEKDNFIKNSELKLAERVRADKAIVASLQKLLHPIVAMEEAAAKEAASIEIRAFDSLHDQLKDRVNSIKKFIDEITKLANESAEAIRRIEQESVGVKRALDAFNFERQIKGLSDSWKISKLMQKSTNLRYEASDAIRKNDEKSAKALTQQSQEYAKQALQIADSSKNSALVRRAEEGVRRSLQGEIDLNDELIKHKKDQAKIAEQFLPNLHSQSAVIKEMVERFNKLKYEAGEAKTPEEFIKTFREMDKLAGQIDQKLQDFTKFKPIAVKLDLQKSFEEATAQLREGLTGQRMDLSSAVYFDSVQIAQALQVTLNTAQKQVSVQIGAVTGVQGARLQQTALTQQPQQLDAAREAEVKRLEALTTVAQAQTNLNALLDKQRLSLNEAATWWDKLRAFSQTVVGSQERLRAGQKAAISPEELRPDIQSANQYISTLARQTAELIRQHAPLDQITTKLSQLTAAETKIRDLGFNEAADAVKALGDELRNQAEAQAAISETTSVVDGLDISLQNAAGTVGLIPQTAVDGVPSFVQAMEAQAQAAESAAARAAAAWQAAAAAAAAASAGKSLGGYIHRATGGSVGTDTVPAMLTPGEFVVNAAATRKFYSQLVAMNSGVKPIFRQEGGPVTTVGDININVNESASPQQTAREIMFSIRREMRRGTATLR